jgi:hypothetical protein
MSEEKAMRALAWVAVLAGLGAIGMTATAEAGGPPAPRTNQQGADFKPPATRESWLARREAIRRRILVSCGLFPLPERTPLNPQVYGKLQRDGYTIEKVVLETLPGFYLSGNLYRPTGVRGKVPGILNPHGHWAEGRVAGDVQARCAGQARMGAVAFLYDMVGYADSKLFGHTFRDDELAAYGLNLNGLQLWNSIRALDWLLTLPDVDPERIGCTGESGGGTQTFELCAVDDRVAVAAPVCMVSHHFQGGCECENAPLKRVGTDNVEFAAAFAPKPQFLVGATGDWTSQIMERGVPEIRQVYRLFGAEQNFDAVIHEAPHNYSQASRQSVYAFLRKHLWWKGARAPVVEPAYTPEDPAAIYTWDAQHPRPAAAATPAAVKAYLKQQVDRQVAEWAPRDAAQWERSRRTLTEALAVLVAAPGAPKTVQRVFTPQRGALGAVVLAHPGGPAGLAPEGRPGPIVAALLEAGQIVVIPDLSRPADAVAKRQAAQYFTTYNPTVVAERVQGILEAVAEARARAKVVRLIGLEGAGPLALLARPLAGTLAATVADGARFEWRALPVTHEMALPGALRYGGMRAFAAAAPTDPLLIHNHGAELDVSWVRAAYSLAGASGRLRLSPTPLDTPTIAAWLKQHRP